MSKLALSAAEQPVLSDKKSPVPGKGAETTLGKDEQGDGLNGHAAAGRAYEVMRQATAAAALAFFARGVRFTWRSFLETRLCSSVGLTMTSINAFCAST